MHIDVPWGATGAVAYTQEDGTRTTTDQTDRRRPLSAALSVFVRVPFSWVLSVVGGRPSVHRRQPFRVARLAAMHDVAVQATQAGGEGADVAVTDRVAIDAHDGLQLLARAAEE